MTTGSSGAVFFLGTRAHYQVLQQPDRFDVENGNASTETIYQNPTVREVWPENGQSERENGWSERGSWSYCDNDTSDDNKIEIGNGVKRRTNRRSSETTLCERDNDMKPALLNSLDSSTPKSKGKPRRSPLSFITSLARRKRHQTEQQYLKHMECALTICTYKESCRCLDCQSRYFECDDMDDLSSDEDDFVPRFIAKSQHADFMSQRYSACYDEDEDDEVFVDTVPDDNTSTDLLIESKMSVSSDEPEPEALRLEVAAGTPVLLNYLLTHPITCAIQ